jgi:hypothetical protein
MYATAEWGAGSDVAGVDDIRGLIRQVTRSGDVLGQHTPSKKALIWTAEGIVDCWVP